MAVAFKDDLIATAFGEDDKIPRKPLDGLVSILYDRTDRDYRRDGDGDKFINRSVFVELVYQPPGNKAALDFYENSDSFLWIERLIPVGEGKRSTLYQCRLLHVWHTRIPSGGGYQDEYKVLLKQDSSRTS